MKNRRLEASRLVRETATELFGVEIGCFDSGCVFGYLGGIHTNGGCSCLGKRDHAEMRITAQRLGLLAHTLALRSGGAA